MTRADASAAPNWSFRADEAARSVTRLFGQRLFFLPGTHIAAIAAPLGPAEEPVPALALLVAGALPGLPRGRRPPGTGPPEHPGPKFDGENRPSAGQLASRLVTGIRLRNFLTVVNNYYDDMAWLALATLRLEQARRGHPQTPAASATPRSCKSLTLQFDSASTDDLGGGTFWSTKRDFKNTPATAPVALYYARTGKPAKAQALLDWLDARLFDPDQGLYRDGLRIAQDGRGGAGRAPSTPTTRGRSSAPCWSSAATPNLGGRPRWWTPWRATSPRPAPLLGPQRRGAALRGNGRRRALHRDPRPLPGPRRRRRTAPGRDPGHGGRRS